MRELIGLDLTLKRWVFIGLVQGTFGAVGFAALGAAWSIANGEWLEALGAPLLIPCVALTSALFALVGFPLFAWLSKQYALADRTASAASTSAPDGNA